jgi:hypothetical protein
MDRFSHGWSYEDLAVKYDVTVKWPVRTIIPQCSACRL